MSMKCDVCGKGPMVGHHQSHAHNMTKRRWYPNLQRIRVNDNGRIRRMRVCTSCIQAGKIQKAV